ncbi:MAG: hypothetical protein LOD88_11360, partial [Novibacillus thermophilus]
MPHTKKSSDDKMLIEKKWGKKKRWVFLALLGLALAVLLSQPTFEDNWTVWKMPLAGQVIVLDPGHGGDDPGA